jgi:hypothetical protein
LFSDVLAAGGSEIDAARSIRLWHITPVGYYKFLKEGSRIGFAAAWQQVESIRRNRIDKHLSKAGVLNTSHNYQSTVRF